MVNDPVNSAGNPPALPDDPDQFILYQTDDGELAPEATIRKFRIVGREGSREVARQIEHYNLDVIISVGYRVKSHRGTQFRIWATHGHIIAERADAANN